MNQTKDQYEDYLNENYEKLAMDYAEKNNDAFEAYCLIRFSESTQEPEEDYDTFEERWNE
jgi:hypothetical protein